MGIINFPQVQGGASIEELANLVAMVIKEVQFLANGNISTQNINEIDAKVIKTGILEAALVTIKAALTGSAEITIDGTGMTVKDTSGNVTLQIDTSGNITTNATIVGGTLETSSDPAARRVVITGNTITIYDSTGARRISINDAGVQSNSSIAFFHADGTTLSAYMYQVGSQLVINSGSDTISFFGNIDFLNATVTNLFSGYTGSFSAVTGVDFIAQTTTSKTITVSNGIVTGVV